MPESIAPESSAPAIAEPQAVAAAVTFEEAIALSQSLLIELEQNHLSDDQTYTQVASLVSSEDGARGFFVTYLTDERPFADQPTAAIVQALKSSPDIVSELLVKNLAMSTAMAIGHRRNQNDQLVQGSDRVQRRTLQLIRLTHLPEVEQRARKLHESATTGIGEYRGFLDRWNYDAEQRQRIAEIVIEAIGES